MALVVVLMFKDMLVPGRFRLFSHCHIMAKLTQRRCQSPRNKSQSHKVTGQKSPSPPSGSNFPPVMVWASRLQQKWVLFSTQALCCGTPIYAQLLAVRHNLWARTATLTAVILIQICHPDSHGKGLI